MKEYPEITIPVREDLKDIAGDLNIPKGMIDYFVDRIIELADVMELCRKGLNDPYADRRRFVDDFQSASKAVSTALSAISRCEGHPKWEMIDLLQESLGILLGPDGGIRIAAVGRALSTWYPKRTSAIWYQEIVEEQGRRPSPFFGSSIPEASLSGLFAVVDSLLAKEFKMQKANTGGRPRDRIRRYIHKDLLELHGRVFSEPATSAPNGTYVKLCECVFDSFGLSTNGEELAVKRYLKSVAASRNPRPNRSEPPPEPSKGSDHRL